MSPRIGPVLKSLMLASALLFAAAAVRAEGARDVLAEMARCSAVTDSGERLRCYDRAAPRAKDVLVPKPEDFGKAPPRPPEITQLSASVRDFSKTLRGRAVFVLDNGQTWRQLEGDDAQIHEPLPGTPPKVMIVRGLFGSYNLTIEGRNGLVRVRRIE
jgi:hypothetical protein